VENPGVRSADEVPSDDWPGIVAWVSDELPRAFSGDEKMHAEMAATRSRK